MLVHLSNFTALKWQFICDLYIAFHCPEGVAAAILAWSEGWDDLSLCRKQDSSWAGPLQLQYVNSPLQRQLKILQNRALVAIIKTGIWKGVRRWCQLSVFTHNSFLISLTQWRALLLSTGCCALWCCKCSRHICTCTGGNAGFLGLHLDIWTGRSRKRFFWY